MTNSTFQYPYQKLTITERLQQIHEYFQMHVGCTINEAVTFIPASKYLVEKYSEHRSGYKPVRAQDDICGSEVVQDV